MAVLLIEPKTFLRVYETLNNQSQNLGWLFGYPKGWNEHKGLSSHLQEFINILYRANLDCYSRQYRTDQIEQELDFSMTTFPVNNFQLLQDLRAIEYNTYDNNGKFYLIDKTQKNLNNLIRWLAIEIIQTHLAKELSITTWG